MSVELTEDGAERFATAGGITVTRRRHETPYEGAIEAYIDALDSHRGAVFSSNYEYPGRYTRWDTAIVDPPLAISARGRDMKFEALERARRSHAAGIAQGRRGPARSDGRFRCTASGGIEGRRARPRLHRGGTQPRSHRVHRPARHRRPVPLRRRPQSRSLRRLRLRSRVPVRPCRTEAEALRKPARSRALPARRDPGRRPSRRPRLARPLRLCRRRLVHRQTCRARAPRRRSARPTRIPPRGDHEPGEYARLVEKAKESFRRGDLFEVVPGQMFFEACSSKPSDITRPAEGDQPLAVFLLHQSRRQRISDRRLARDVRAGQRPPRRDLPDLRHHQARRRRHRGLRADPQAAQLQEGRIRADHVLRRRPQRQVAASASRARCASSAGARSRCIRA